MQPGVSIDRRGEQPDAWTFGYITLAQTEDLGRHHPLAVRALETGSRHGPTHLASLRTCPDSDPGFPCYFYLATPERIVASLRALPDRLHHGGETFRWAWCADLFTDPELRGKGLAMRVVEESVAVLHERDTAWGGGFASPVTLHICRRLGFQIPGFGPRLMLMKTVRPFASFALRSAPLGRLADVPYRAAYLGLLSPFLRFRLGRRDRFHPETCEDPEDLRRWDWPAQVYDGSLRFNDGLEKLIWKLRYARGVSLRVIRDASTDQPLCYLATKTRPSEQTFLSQFGRFELMTVMDFGVFAGDAHYRTAVHAAVLGFLDSSADMLEIISSSRTLNREAGRLGFVRVGKGTPLIFHLPPSWDLGPDAFDPMNWRITHFTGDGFGFR